MKTETLILSDDQKADMRKAQRREDERRRALNAWLSAACHAALLRVRIMDSLLARVMKDLQQPETKASEVTVTH